MPGPLSRGGRAAGGPWGHRRISGQERIADAAREWIARDVPEVYRSALYRRVNSGVLTAISNERQNRTRVVAPRSSVE